MNPTAPNRIEIVAYHSSKLHGHSSSNPHPRPPYSREVQSRMSVKKHQKQHKNLIFMALLAIQSNPNPEATNPKTSHSILYERGK